MASYACETASMDGKEHVAVRNPEPLQPGAHVASRGAGEQEHRLGDPLAQLLGDGEQHVRALDQLRLEPVAPADAVLLERADDERGLGKPERAAGVRPTLRVRGRNASVSIPIGIRWSFSDAIPVSRISSSIALEVTCTRSISACRRRRVSKQASNSGMPGVPGRPWK